MLLFRVHVDGVQTDLSCAARLPLILHCCGEEKDRAGKRKKEKKVMRRGTNKVRPPDIHLQC